MYSVPGDRRIGVRTWFMIVSELQGKEEIDLQWAEKYEKEKERERRRRTHRRTRTVSLTHESKTVMANENVHESRKKLMDQTELSTCICCDLCIYLSMLGFHQSLHLQRGKLSVRLKSAAIPPQLKRVKKEFKREMV